MANKYSVARATEEEAGEVVSIWEVLGRRWSLLILKNLCTKEVIRFNEFKKLLSGISSTVLADRLLELEREGLVSKKIYPQIPPKVEYSLTIRAKELGVILRELGKWASRWKVPRITTNTKTTSAARSSS
ncbi:MAG TPA: helix-turn-helix domain-containing protein [Candidatus Nitrosopolaris rasttigaisensis]|jgi:DNA-binding HxlR family transcriptional regulator|nr:helix-turn-helix domain-containing protein [Candidatus Nitrosopolaris rasttigaisensis]